MFPRPYRAANAALWHFLFSALARAMGIISVLVHHKWEDIKQTPSRFKTLTRLTYQAFPDTHRLMNSPIIYVFGSGNAFITFPSRIFCLGGPKANGLLLSAPADPNAR